MAHSHTVLSHSPASTQRRRALARGSRVIAFWVLVCVISVAAFLAASLDPGLHVAATAARPAVAMSLAVPAPDPLILLAQEPEFLDRFVQAKRDAGSEELPAQF